MPLDNILNCYISLWWFTQNLKVSLPHIHGIFRPSFFYAALLTGNKYFPDRLDCILWCIFPILCAIAINILSTNAFTFPRPRKRLNCRSALTFAKVLSDWMLRFTRSPLPFFDVMRSKSSARFYWKTFEISKCLVRSSKGVLLWFPWMHCAFNVQQLQFSQVYCVFHVS